MVFVIIPDMDSVELTRRISLKWTGFRKLRYICKEQMIPINLKRKVFSTCVLPVATYCQETTTLQNSRKNHTKTFPEDNGMGNVGN